MKQKSMHKMFKRIGQFTQLCVSISTKKFQPHVNYKLCRAIPQPAFKCYSTSEGNTNANVQNIDPDVKKELNQLKLEVCLFFQFQSDAYNRNLTNNISSR